MTSEIEWGEKAVVTCAGPANVAAAEDGEESGSEGKPVVAGGAAALPACAMKCDRALMTSGRAGRIAGFESQHRCMRLATWRGT